MERLTKLILSDDGKSDLSKNIEMIKKNSIDIKIVD